MRPRFIWLGLAPAWNTFHFEDLSFQSTDDVCDLPLFVPKCDLSWAIRGVFWCKLHTIQGPRIIPIKACPTAGQFCPDRGPQVSLNLSGFSYRPSNFHAICPDSWISLQKWAKNHQKSPKKSPVRNSLDFLAIE